MLKKSASKKAITEKTWDSTFEKAFFVLARFCLLHN